ncbi:MAG TPA: glycosyl hydrolase family 8 [Polyangia bacterium]
MKLYRRTLTLLGCAVFALGAGACGGGSRPEQTGTAGDGAAGDAGPGAAGTTGTGGSAGSAGSTGTAGTTGRGGTTGSAGSTGTAGTGVPAGGIFASLLGKSQTDIDSKVTTAVNRYFGIGTSESATPTAASGYRCYYELPQDSSMGFIWAADSDDVRSEGMSYGMMIAVQMNMQTQFDRLWKFAKTYMQFPSTSSITAWRGYFIWQGKVNRGSTTSWTVTFSTNTGPAPDGDQYFAAALYLADKRWGSAGATNYKQEADNIAAAMLHNPSTASDGRQPIISASQNMPVFYPQGASAGFTDPSYHLPAFYELFAASGPSADAAKWRTVASTSRGFFVTSANATSGLHPDYATFAGAPTTAAAGDGHDTFGYDAWRVVMNMAVDYVWGAADSREKTQIEKMQTFFNSYLTTGNVSQCLFAVNGSNASGGGSTALTATLAAGSMVSTTSNRTMFANNLWLIQQQSGTYRYYQESVYLLGLLNAAGKFQKSF